MRQRRHRCEPAFNNGLVPGSFWGKRSREEPRSSCVRLHAILRKDLQMTQGTRWRVVTDGDASGSEALTADMLAARLWDERELLPWVEPVEGGEGAEATDIPEVRAFLLRDPLRVARARLKHTEQPEWLFLWVMDLCEALPDEAWSLILALVEASRSDLELAYVAAGPLEQLARCNGHHVIIEAEAAANERFRLALSGVWRSSIPRSVWDRLVAAVGDGPTLDGWGA
jgi:hypothetical protein